MIHLDDWHCLCDDPNCLCYRVISEGKTEWMFYRDITDHTPPVEKMTQNEGDKMKKNDEEKGQRLHDQS